MGSPTDREAHRICNLLQYFCDASGMDINKEKYQIFFLNTPHHVQLHITLLLSSTHSSLMSKYLGIPLIDKALCNSSWEGLLSSLEKRISS